MPECQTCDRYFAPNAVLDDGSCPKCGTQVASTSPTQTKPKVPWHFWLMLMGVVGYLGWRLIELVIWLFGEIF